MQDQCDRQNLLEHSLLQDVQAWVMDMVFDINKHRMQGLILSHDQRLTWGGCASCTSDTRPQTFVGSTTDTRKRECCSSPSMIWKDVSFRLQMLLQDWIKHTMRSWKPWSPTGSSC